MPTRRFAIAAASAIALMAPSTADAFKMTGQPLASPRITVGIAAARAYFGTLPACPTGITFTKLESGPSAFTIGVSTGPCDIALDAEWLAAVPRSEACGAVVHEIGHSLDLPHTSGPTPSDPLHVMVDGEAGATPGVVPLCQPRYLRSLVKPKGHR